MPFDNFEVMTTEAALSQCADQPSRSIPATRLGAMLSTHGPIAQTAIVERHYVDADYSASYHDQRGRAFTPRERSTTRIHFFSEQFTKDDLVEAAEHTVQRMTSSYKGFTVVRPDWPATLGRTFVACPSDISGEPSRFPTRSTTQVDLAGIPLKIESCPYMSQDEKIMACATAATWMSTTPLAEKIPGVATHTTAEITSLAMSLNRPFGPSVGRRGLTWMEMEQALLHIGFDPRVHEPPKPDDLVEICHLFSDSGIAPILTLDLNGIGHAVTVVGYTLKSTSGSSNAKRETLSAHKFVSNLVIHDDQRGMYLPVAVAPTKSGPAGLTDLFITIGQGEFIGTCAEVLIPFPKRIMLDAVEVTGHAEEWIRQAKEGNWIEDRPVVYRTLLVQSNVLKQTLLARQDRGNTASGYPTDLVTFTRSLPMPRFVWLIEVSYQNDWDPSSPTAPPVIADFVLDSTSTEITRPDYLMLHVPRTALGLHVEGNRARRITQEISPDYPHPPFPNIPRP